MFDTQKLKRANKKLLEENERLQEKVDQKNDEINKLRSDFGNQKAELKRTLEKLDRAKEKIRDQAAADLLVSSFRILAMLLRDQKPEKSDLEKQAELQQQLYQLIVPMKQSSYTSYSGSLFGGLGLGL